MKRVCVIACVSAMFAISFLSNRGDTSCTTSECFTTKCVFTSSDVIWYCYNGDEVAFMGYSATGVANPATPMTFTASGTFRQGTTGGGFSAKKECPTAPGYAKNGIECTCQGDENAYANKASACGNPGGGGGSGS